MYWCSRCNSPIECEFMYLNETGMRCLAQIKHLDYLVCKNHERIAISNVASRGMVDEPE